jgi:hypothetical protein
MRTARREPGPGGQHHQQQPGTDRRLFGQYHSADPASARCPFHGPLRLQAGFNEIFDALDLVSHALSTQDMSTAIRICQSEFALDQLYGSISTIRCPSWPPADVGDLVTSLFIFHYLERMGDSLLNIGEALIFALIGEKLKIHQFQALSDTLAASGLTAPFPRWISSPYGAIGSGCRVGAVQEKAGGASRNGSSSRKAA